MNNLNFRDWHKKERFNLTEQNLQYWRVPKCRTKKTRLTDQIRLRILWVSFQKCWNRLMSILRIWVLRRCFWMNLKRENSSKLRKCHWSTVLTRVSYWGRRIADFGFMRTVLKSLWLRTTPMTCLRLCFIDWLILLPKNRCDFVRRKRYLNDARIESIRSIWKFNNNNSQQKTW